MEQRRKILFILIVFSTLIFLTPSAKAVTGKIVLDFSDLIIETATQVDNKIVIVFNDSILEKVQKPLGKAISATFVDGKMITKYRIFKPTPQMHRTFLNGIAGYFSLNIFKKSNIRINIIK